MQYKYEKLEVWQLSIELSKEVYRLSNHFPKEEIYGLTSQIRRAVISITLNTAEGSMRSSNKEFSYFIRIAIGSLVEVRACLQLAVALDYLKNIDLELEEVLNKVYFMLLKLDKKIQSPNVSNNLNNSSVSTR
jgi:four helix bundle protein